MSSRRPPLKEGPPDQALEQADRRLEHLYEIGKLFATFEDVRRTFDPALAIVGRTLPIRSAIVIEAADTGTELTLWTSEGQEADQLQVIIAHAEEAYGYLTGAPTPAGSQRRVMPGLTTLPRQAPYEGDAAKRFIVIPLVVARRPPFGALQLEGGRPLDESDLRFVNSIANQLAIAIDRDRAWRRDIELRDRAEEEKAQAVKRSATAERNRAIAENLSEKYEAMATENARLYEEAQQAVRVREQILAVVSHDLRNPLGTILLMAGAIAKSDASNQPRASLSKDAERIQAAAQRILRLIEDLLDFASIEAGRLAVKRSLQDPSSVLQETVETFEGQAEEKQLKLTAEIDPDLPKIYFDRDRLMQVFSNLVGNAIKVTAEGGRVTLRVVDHDHELLFVVSDDGPGFSEEDAKHLFERYWRSGEAEYKGTGLGLAIAKGIVTAHGGRIWAESKLGRGATFYFTVPAADDRRHRTRRIGEPQRP